MKDENIGELAKKLGISKSTVSKTLRHCSGVDSDTRRLILAESGSVSWRWEGECAIYAILPDTPSYFWHEVRRGVQENEDRSAAPLKLNIYTKTSDTDTVSGYLDEAAALGAKVILLAANITPEISDKLTALTKNCFVVFVSEYSELVNGFYVGSDSFADGYAMGSLAVRQYRHRIPMILRQGDSINLRHRLDGFNRALSEHGMADRAVYLDLPSDFLRDKRTFPSQLASLLWNQAKDEASYLLYSPGGVTQLPNAVNKAGLGGRMVCMCHDCASMEGIAVCCRQNVYEQGKSAMEAAAEFVRHRMYPPQKCLYIPSDIIYGD